MDRRAPLNSASNNEVPYPMPKDLHVSDPSGVAEGHRAARAIAMYPIRCRKICTCQTPPGSPSAAEQRKQERCTLSDAERSARARPRRGRRGPQSSASNCDVPYSMPNDLHGPDPEGVTACRTTQRSVRPRRGRSHRNKNDHNNGGEYVAAREFHNAL